jgi:hypothetical protein
MRAVIIEMDNPEAFCLQRAAAVDLDVFGQHIENLFGFLDGPEKRADRQSLAKFLFHIWLQNWS